MSSEPDSKGTGFKYWAFLSYSHQDNLATRQAGQRDCIRWAEWLHNALERYRVPNEFRDRHTTTGEPMPDRFFPVFQDEKELPINADLGESIRRALEGSRFLIVICSPRSAISRYVNEEVRYFKELGRQNRIMALIIDGEPNASLGYKAGYSAADECFCPALRFSLDANGEVDTTRSDAQEPIAGDVRVKDEASAREAKQADLSSHQPVLEYMKLKLLAGLMGVGFDELAQRDKVRALEEARAKARRARRVAAVVAGFALVAIVSAYLAFQQKQTAQRESERAVASEQTANEKTAEALAAEQTAREKTKIAQRETDRAVTAEQTAQEKAAEVVRNSSRADFIAADEALKAGLNQQALARLARAVRDDPQNFAAGRRLLFLLLQQPWFVPAPPGKLATEFSSGPSDPSAAARRAGAKALAEKRLGELDQARRVTPYTPAPSQGARVVVSDSGGAVAIATEGEKGGQVEWLDNPPGSGSRRPFNAGFPIEALAFSPDEERLAVVGGVQIEFGTYGAVAVLRKDGSTVEPRRLDRGPVSEVAFSPDERLFVSASSWWDGDGHPLGSFSSEGETNIRFSADGRTVTVDGHPSIQLGRPPISKSLGEDPADGSTLLHERVPPDTKYKLTGEDNIGGTLTNPQNGRSVQLPAVWVVDAAFHPDGQRLLLVLHDKIARLWDIKSARWSSEAITLRDTDSEAVFAPDGSCFATSSSDGGAGYGDFQLWDTETMRPLSRPIEGSEIFGQRDAPLGPLRFTPSWRLVLFAGPSEGSDQIAQYFAFDVPRSDEPVPGWIADLAEAVAGSRLTARSVFERIDTATLWKIIAEVRATTARGEDTWSTTIRWWLNESADRAISPRSSVKVSAYVQRRLNSTNPRDLVLAGRAAPDNRDVFERLAAVASKSEYTKGVALSASRRALWLGGKPRGIGPKTEADASPRPSDGGEAEFARGEAFRNGEGVEKNPREAFACYQRAAEMGHVAALHRIGVMFATGSGVTKDESQAVEWYQKAAEKGFAEAQYDLGVRYILGRGVEKNERLGLEWYRKAAAQGWHDAINALRQRDASRK